MEPAYVHMNGGLSGSRIGRVNQLMNLRILFCGNRSFEVTELTVPIYRSCGHRSCDISQLRRSFLIN